ncbi:MAG: Bax inhibitor-1 family protein [Anaerolineae bacterium]
MAFASLAAVVFSGFILYDTSRILRYAGQMSPVSAALSLYLDFYNLFLALLRLLNRR